MSVPKGLHYTYYIPNLFCWKTHPFGEKPKTIWHLIQAIYS